MALARSLDWSIPVNFFSVLGFLVHLIVFVAKNSGGVKKKPMIIVKEFFFSF